MLNLKLKENQSINVIYQGLKVSVPVGTNFMWLQHTGSRLLLLASPNKPTWSNERQDYLLPRDTSKVAELENTGLTIQQLKDSLEVQESEPSEQDLEQLDVVVNLVHNLRSFASTLERNIAKASDNPSTERIQALLKHVYAQDGELDTFYNKANKEAEDFNIITQVYDANSESLDFTIKAMFS